MSSEISQTAKTSSTPIITRLKISNYNSNIEEHGI